MSDRIVISELEELALVDKANDWVPVVDVSDTSASIEGTTKKAVVNQFVGPAGSAATVSVGTTTTGNPGTDASVVNVGTNSDAVFNFTIPRGDTGATGDSAYVYIAYASDINGSGFTTTFNPSLDYIAIKATTEQISNPQASDFTGLWKNYKGAQGVQGPQGEIGPTGAPGVDGVSAYVYIAYASDDSGTGFTTVFNPNLDYIAIKATTTEILNPQASDFTGLWKNYRGATGPQGVKGDAGEDGLDINWLGVYDTNTSYVKNDAVFYSGSSYICKQPSTGNLPTNTNYWDLMAQQGAPGEGSGDVVGPSSATNNAVVRFSGVTGKLVKDSTVTITDGGSINIPSGQNYLINGNPIDPDVGNAIHTASSKTTPVDADTTALVDSEASNVLKKISWLNIKTTLKSYFDTLYNNYVHPNHSGDVTSAGDGATTISNGVVTNAKMANMATKTYKGRTSGTTGTPEDVPVATLKSDLSLVKGDVGLGNVDNVQQMPLSYLDTDANLTANSDAKVPSQKAIKAYVDAKGYTWRGAWATSTAYALNDTVENNGSGYVCTSAHTSGSTTEPGVGASWTDKWDLFVEGLPEPNLTTATTTNLTGYLYGDGTNLGVKTATNLL